MDQATDWTYENSEVRVMSSVDRNVSPRRRKYIVLS